jgi:hypothetical protein
MACRFLQAFIMESSPSTELLIARPAKVLASTEIENVDGIENKNVILPYGSTLPVRITDEINSKTARGSAMDNVELIRGVTAFLFMICVPLIAAVIVARDAKQRGMNGAAWGVGTFLLCIVFLPLYFIVRNPLPSTTLPFVPQQSFAPIGRPQLCRSCGKYNEGTPAYCPLCGAPQATSM